MIKKIKNITSMGIYKGFDWDRTVRESNGGIPNFERINILYGRNYSGKTTLSRIIRSLETGFLSDKFKNPEFTIEMKDGTNVQQNNPQSHNQLIRVFNEDFIKENLSYITNPNESIKSFAILGDDNNKLELEIKKMELELGSEESNTGLNGIFKENKNNFSKAERELKDIEENLESKLFEKANKVGTGIKHNKEYGYATYNAQKLKIEIEEISTQYSPLQMDEAEKLKKLLKEEPKSEILNLKTIQIKYKELYDQTKNLVEKKITISESLQRLLDNSLLSEWVKQGRNLHREKRTECGFCGNPLPASLWIDLDKHFNKESEQLEIEINALIVVIQRELHLLSSFNLFNHSDFYSSFFDDLEKIRLEFEEFRKLYTEILDAFISLLNRRIKDIPSTLNFGMEYNNTLTFEKIFYKLNSKIDESNNMTANLTEKQNEARKLLRLNEVCKFTEDIQYTLEKSKIEKKNIELREIKEKVNEAQTKVDAAMNIINKLKSELKDETKGAEKVNFYLNNYFGHNTLSLVAEQADVGYRFEIVRDGKKAHHLSQGESSLVAFCYFIAKLDDIETKDNNPIIWIDDPISSLDSNHIFFIFSLIGSEIVKKNIYKQLFISTHNLDFLKYLKRLPPKDVNNNDILRKYFIFERKEADSEIRVMPSYLKSYITEFNYLFHQIYRCAIADIQSVDENHDCFYNYGNNTRKFLEAFLYYKYPNAKEKDEKKLERFFGNDAISTILTERINNEYSHLAGVFERSMNPIDVPEMKNTARFILARIKEKDKDQYNALLESINGQDFL
jgi:wobble nucleotide-excising tRNase